MFKVNGTEYRMTGNSADSISAGITDCDTSDPRVGWTCIRRHWNAEAGAWICFEGEGIGTYTSGEIGLSFADHQHTSVYVVPEQISVTVERQDGRIVGTFQAVVKRNVCASDEVTLEGHCTYEECENLSEGRFDVPYLGAIVNGHCRTAVGPGVGANGPTCP